jgi:hypothetical protein
MPSAVPLLEVHLLQVPVPLWAQAQEHSDSLQREFALMSMGGTADGERSVPARLLELVAALRGQYSSATTEQVQQLLAAHGEGRGELPELVYRVPPGAAQAAQQVGDMFDEADAFCRDGRHLLTLATPPELVAFRRWYLGEFVRQADGSPPVPWPAYRS